MTLLAALSSLFHHCVLCTRIRRQCINYEWSPRGSIKVLQIDKQRVVHPPTHLQVLTVSLYAQSNAKYVYANMDDTSALVSGVQLHYYAIVAAYDFALLRICTTSSLLVASQKPGSVHMIDSMRLPLVINTPPTSSLSELRSTETSAPRPIEFAPRTFVLIGNSDDILITGAYRSRLAQLVAIRAISPSPAQHIQSSARQIHAEPHPHTLRAPHERSCGHSLSTLILAMCIADAACAGNSAEHNLRSTEGCLSTPTEACVARAGLP